MNKLFLVALLASTAATLVFAQGPAPFPAPRGGGSSMLNPQDQQALQAADAKAKNDPAVEAAAEKMHAASMAARAAMVARDPSIAPLLNEMQPAASPSPGAEPHHLTADEYLKIRAARLAIVDTPEGHAWKQATEDYQAAHRAAMIAADPSVTPILARLSHGASVARPSIAATGLAMPTGTPSASPKP